MVMIMTLTIIIELPSHLVPPHLIPFHPILLHHIQSHSTPPYPIPSHPPPLLRRRRSEFSPYGPYGHGEAPAFGSFNANGVLGSSGSSDLQGSSGGIVPSGEQVWKENEMPGPSFFLPFFFLL